jgi:hypothetical protein
MTTSSSPAPMVTSSATARSKSAPVMMSEAYIQALVHQHPACLPIAEIDPMFSHPVPIVPN